MTAPFPVQLIAIVGGSGAGKGWLVARLCERLGDHACHLPLDDFYRDRSHLPLSERAELNFDIPDAIDWEAADRVLHECRAGRPTRVPRYDFSTYSRIEEDERTFHPRLIVLVDGLWLLHPPRIRALFDLKVFIDTPTEVRCARRLARDVAERGYSPAMIERQLRTAVLPMHDQYVEPQKQWADLVLTHPIEVGHVDELARRISDIVGGALRPDWQTNVFSSGHKAPPTATDAVAAAP